GDRDRAGAGRCLSPRPSGVAEHAFRHARKLREILIDETVARAAETRQAIFDISCIARLRHLSVVDDVDAGLPLPADDLTDCTLDARVQGVLVDRLSLLFRIHHL